MFLRFSGEPPAVVVCNIIPSSGGFMDILPQFAEKGEIPRGGDHLLIAPEHLTVVMKATWQLDSPWTAGSSRTSCG